MSVVVDIELMDLVRQLYPNGRAWNIAPYTNIYNMYSGLVLGKRRAIDTAKYILNTLMPDNEAFGVDEANVWMDRLQIPYNDATLLDDKKAAIKRKQGHPNNVLYRQSSAFMEDQLKQAGFDVKVTSPISPDIYRPVVDPNATGSSSRTAAPHGDSTSHGANTSHGESADVVATQVIISQLDPDREVVIAQAAHSLRALIFISADPFPSYVSILKSREKEFRDLVLRLKPMHSHVYFLGRMVDDPNSWVDGQSNNWVDGQGNNWVNVL